MTASTAIRAAFILSGVAGLVYEVLWSRYLGLFVGHTAYAQVLVLGVYLGGMGVGSFAISDLSKRLSDPLRGYVMAEVVLAAFGLLFHPLFVFTTSASYDTLFPALGSAAAVGAVRWALAGLLILPQAVVLGATFPLMAAGLVRADAERPGGGIAMAYLLNTLGGAFGVILAGFVLIGWVGLPGTSVTAAAINLSAAGLVLWARRSESSTASEPVESPSPDTRPEGRDGTAAGPSDVGPGLAPVLLTVAFGTALASFTYEIGWIRMLSLVLGSATHAFEIMLSAFILGIAVGAWSVRRHADGTPRPVAYLGWVQVAMGVTAVASLPLYLGTFGLMSGMVQMLSGEPGGYALFNVGRYGLALLVMLPSTVLAGMTLPLVTAALLRAGHGERAIGRVYGLNTFGSVTGAGIAGLVALPYLGLEGLIVAGALLDVLLGVWLLERSGAWSGVGRRPALAASIGAAACFVGVTAVVELTPETITSGVFRRGVLAGEDRLRSLFYQDGRTSTVSAHIGTSDGVIVLATNGKPDASLGPRWILDRRDTLPELPIPQGRDFTTQALAPVVTLAHRPEARTGANIGHGSGMTAASLLTSGELERLVTIEIEPLMVEASFVFLPANGPAFGDPRVTYVFDDAKSYFSYQRERFDLIFAEPSNPWVSGTASLFTVEFYRRVTDFLSDGAVLGQWVQIYELDDDLFLSVVAALDAVFPSYRAYLVGDADVAIVATLDDSMAQPDWSVVENEAFRAFTTSAPPFLAQHFEPLLLFDQNTFRSLLDAGVPPNSDFRPILDLGAERTRFDEEFAAGVYSLATSRVNLQRHLSGQPLTPRPFRMPPAYGLNSTVLAERGAWLRAALSEGGGIAPEEFEEWQEDLVNLQRFLVEGLDGYLGSWRGWVAAFVQAENTLHWGLSGHVEQEFYEEAYRVLDEEDAPPTARAVVDLLHGYGVGDWARAAAAVDILTASTSGGDGWLPTDLLLDVGVLAYLEADRPTAALSLLDELAPRTSRGPDDLRTRLLRGLAEEAAGIR
ncbi:MAG: hypothetical protein HKN72_13780 [Gemmatimonadetes bacterium]|nr:hypothetical protein [Gemmatimonadota bacterium]NNF14296.1 hypothetical protein [Gemmatimonadota bacterium]NNL29664.1 hypothetical protein [Gemmatimonadota bacterium]